MLCSFSRQIFNAPRKIAENQQGIWKLGLLSDKPTTLRTKRKKKLLHEPEIKIKIPHTYAITMIPYVPGIFIF